ncbi:hypothetical protein CsSME_00018001 [Camellia sinensis var. sinensis]
MVTRNTPPANGLSEGPIIVACQWNMSSPTGPVTIKKNFYITTIATIIFREDDTRSKKQIHNIYCSCNLHLGLKIFLAISSNDSNFHPQNSPNTKSHNFIACVPRVITLSTHCIKNQYIQQNIVRTKLWTWLKSKCSIT